MLLSKPRGGQALTCVVLWLELAIFSGCQMTAPIHVWKRPGMGNQGPVRIAVSPIAGDPEVAMRLQEAMAASKPQTMPQLAVVFPHELERVGGIQLVSYDGQPSDMASLGAARRAGAQYVLSGQVISHDLHPPPEPQTVRWSLLPRIPPDPETLTVRWVVYEVATGKRVGDNTVTMDRLDAEKHYPDLAFQASGDVKVLAASARRSWELLVPTTHATDVLIDLPWFSYGSSQVRKGNAYARQGRWELAEREWQEAADKNNWNAAAWTNLSIAAVAHEDFPLARARLKHADSKLWPGNEKQKTLLWIEERQREYHDAFQLPPPADGWSIPDPPVPAIEGQPMTMPSQPKSLDDQPWYTAIPFVPPPGWTWTRWWSQPWIW